jgi:hypothetical protein
MKSSQHVSEESLIELHLDESANAAVIRQHLEGCAECAAMSESIAETLRVFSASVVPPVDLDQQWQRLRGALPRLPVDVRPQRRFPRWLLLASGSAFAAIVLILALTYRPLQRMSHDAGANALVRTGPFTNAPVEPLDPQIEQQLDGAERLLTVVNHTSGPLDEATREQAHNLLLKNAVYIRMAREEGDPGKAVVLDDLGRLLTNIDHANSPNDSGWDLRLEWNTKGLLLDIRILRQDDSRHSTNLKREKQ